MELGHLFDGRDEVGKLLADGREPTRFLRRLEERGRVGAVRDGYRDAPSFSSTEKSSSETASSMSRR
jgi:hypothetical protein